VRSAASLVALLAGLLGSVVGPANAQPIDTLVVGVGAAFATVGEAVAAARPYAVVVVRPGVYREPTIVVDRPLTISGEGDAILDGENERELILVTASGVTVRGMTLRNTGTSYVHDRAALKAMDVSDCVFEGNRIENAFFGIYLGRVSDCRISQNVLLSRATTESLAGNGIHLWTAERIDITDNRVRGHRDGIYLEFTSGATVRRNVSGGNLRYGLHFMYSDSCEYTENEFAANLAGVAVMYSRNVRMTGNRFSDSWGAASYGLLLKEIYDPVLEGNVFLRNTVGVVADGAVRIQARGNVFERNGWGIRLLASTHDGVFERNDFLGNTFDVTTNSFHVQNRFSGNYFDSYRAYDLDRDGFGDVPHRPVRLFAVLIERSPAAILLLRSFLVGVLDLAERMIPAVTPSSLVDDAPAMRRWL
jgi:nitrous oxidase accessory protein